MSVRVPLVSLPTWIKAASRCGLNIGPLFAEQGIDPDLTQIADHSVEVQVMDALLLASTRRAPSGHFPFVFGECFAFDYLPDFETFLSTSDNLREAARVFAWIRELIDPRIDIRIEEDEGRGEGAVMLMTDAPSDSETLRYYVESAMAAVDKFARELLGSRHRLLAARFRHARPDYADRYADVFGAPVAFGCERNALVYPLALFDLPLEGAFPSLHQQAEQQVARRIQDLHGGQGGLVAAVRRAFEMQPELLQTGQSEMAAYLGLGVRSLQRRLAADGESFRELRDRALRRAAEQALLQEGVGIEQVAERLGFSDRRSFTRAFRRWSGMTPSTWRGWRRALPDKGN